MKLKFKIQPFQTRAVASVVDCFVGQPPSQGETYRIDPGRGKRSAPGQYQSRPNLLEVPGLKNAPLQLREDQVLENIRQVQRRQGLPESKTLFDFTTIKHGSGIKYVPATQSYIRQCQKASPIHLDVEMETGTGKTYCYIKTIFELHKRYGWTKFIVITPSIAIREGVLKSLEITADHFAEIYSQKSKFFVYNSKNFQLLENFSSDAGINIMVINIQAFNATGKDNRRIYEVVDDFQSRRPIDVISSNNPILILDEPQKMEGKKTLEALAQFNPLMVLRYSATHRTIHNKVHRLDALDAYNQKLVKRIAARGITVRGLPGTNAYLYLESIEISKQAPLARIELEVRQKSGVIQRTLKPLGRGRDLFDVSNGLDQYRGFTIAQIDARTDTVEFTNGVVLYAGDAIGDITEEAFRRIQIREAIRAHLETERRLFGQGIKVLSLFFIDAVVKYRDYRREDTKGEYARLFEEEYDRLKAEYLGTLPCGDENYREYLRGIPVVRTHKGYFAIDKKTRHLTDPHTLKRGEEAGLSDDVDAYDLILKEKEKLLSFDEPVRFLFSHSALREGWDNPNVFGMCMLKHSDSTISRRQEVGRGLRLCVNQQGDRMDDPATVHDINVLTVVAGEGYTAFVDNLQKEISDSLSMRPRQADIAYFTDKIITTDGGRQQAITPLMAKHIYRYLVQQQYTDDADQLTETYRSARDNGSLAALPEDLVPYAQEIFRLIDNVFSPVLMPSVENDRNRKANPLNENFRKKEFQTLWENINHKAVYSVDFDSMELIKNSINIINTELHVVPLQYTIQRGIQKEETSDAELRNGHGFSVTSITTESETTSVHATVPYDLIGKLAESTKLTRKTIVSILIGIHPVVFDQFKQNPEQFIANAARLIKEQKATTIIEKLCYNTINSTYSTDIFTDAQTQQNFTHAFGRLKKHIYDYAITDSGIERDFIKDLDNSDEVIVYAKLPHGFFIPTPVGKYNPDWAIAFREGSVKYIYFVAETKGSMSKMELRLVEEKKIACARKFFAELNRRIDPEHVHYDVVTSYEKLMEIVAG